MNPLADKLEPGDQDQEEPEGVTGTSFRHQNQFLTVHVSTSPVTPAETAVYWGPEPVTVTGSFWNQLEPVRTDQNQLEAGTNFPSTPAQVSFQEEQVYTSKPVQPSGTTSPSQNPLEPVRRRQNQQRLDQFSGRRITNRSNCSIFRSTDTCCSKRNIWVSRRTWSSGIRTSRTI